MSVGGEVDVSRVNSITWIGSSFFRFCSASLYKGRTHLGVATQLVLMEEVVEFQEH